MLVRQLSVRQLPGGAQWMVDIVVEGGCQACGEDLTQTAQIRATPDWVKDYNNDDILNRAVRQTVRRKVVARHERMCVGRRATAV